MDCYYDPNVDFYSTYKHKIVQKFLQIPRNHPPLPLFGPFLYPKLSVTSPKKTAWEFLKRRLTIPKRCLTIPTKVLFYSKTHAWPLCSWSVLFTGGKEMQATKCRSSYNCGIVVLLTQVAPPSSQPAGSHSAAQIWAFYGETECSLSVDVLLIY